MGRAFHDRYSCFLSIWHAPASSFQANDISKPGGSPSDFTIDAVATKKPSDQYRQLHSAKEQQHKSPAPL